MKDSRHRILILILFNLLTLILLLFLPNGLKVEIRNSVFSTAVDGSYFKLTPDQLQDRHSDFIWFDPEIRDGYLKRIHQKAGIDSLVSLHLSDRELIKKLTLIFSKNGSSEPGDCGRYSDDLIRNMEWLNTDDGKGCCSDHAQVLIAYSLLADISCREVHNIPHTFNEYYDRQEKKWVWIDPQYCLLAKDSTDHFLSLIEIQNYYQADHKPVWEFFGTKMHMADTVAPLKINDLYIKSAFDVIRMTLGNNVFMMDSINHKLSYLPRSIRQFYLLTLNEQPRWVYHSNDNKVKVYYNSIRYGFFSFILLVLLIDILVVFKIIIKHNSSSS